MTAGDALRLAGEGVARAPLRAVLTGTGIAIAITVLVLMVGFGAGVQQVVNEIVATEDTLTTMKIFSEFDTRWRNARRPDSERGEVREDETKPETVDGVSSPSFFGPEVERALRALPGVRHASLDFSVISVMRREDGQDRRKLPPFERRCQVIGLHPAALPADAADRFAEGGLPAPDDVRGIVLSQEAARRIETGDRGPVVGSRIVVQRLSIGRSDEKGVVFTVTGVLKPRERLSDLASFNPLMMGSRRYSYVWEESARELYRGAFRGLTDLLPFAELGAEGAEIPADATLSATVLLRSPGDAEAVRKKIEAMGFRVMYLGDLLQRVRLIFLVADGILAALGTVALLVASLGIANTLLMAVLERTREIGILKAIGARDREVALVFVGEAAFLGLAGGVLGCLLGWGGGEGASAIVNAVYIVPEQGPDAAADLFAMPLWLAGGALGLALFLSLAAAVYPAWRAARVDPVRALRYE
ncbi:MAG: ABC transporter permease [Planctomycetales bacterium]|nr:ABC transporter permease [Planctomycetales bacterium]